MADRSVPVAEPVGVEPVLGAHSGPLYDHSLNAWQRTFSALRYPNFRLWFYGQLVSAVGTWMQITAQGFLVFQLTHSTSPR